MDPAERLQLYRELRNRQTPTEEFFWELVRDRRFEGFKFRRQHPLGNFVADFYCSDHMLAIELDGNVHDQNPEHDEVRDEFLSLQGIRVLRVRNDGILRDTEAVHDRLWDTLSPLSIGDGEGVRG